MGLDNLIPEEQIRARSYAIWEAEGRPEGHCEEHWTRACAELLKELERSWLVALEGREDTDLVMPRLPISKRPLRSEAGRIDPDHFQEAA
jgi:hypothetical protein